jgi:hypothetical protein
MAVAPVCTLSGIINNNMGTSRAGRRALWHDAAAAYTLGFRVPPRPAQAPGHAGEHREEESGPGGGEPEPH